MWGGRLYPGGLVIGCIFCLQVDGPITGGLVSGGGEGAYIREACNQMYFLFTGRWANKWGVGVGEECL